MKRLIVLFVAVLASACMPTGPDRISQQRSVIAFDFSEYTEQGFMITPQDYEGEYRSIGMINMTISPKARRSENIIEESQLPSDQFLVNQWIVNRITTDELIEAAYQKAREMGADAIIDFSVTGGSRSPAPGLTIPEYTVSGFAIQRVNP